jgi:hypothetical protein
MINYSKIFKEELYNLNSIEKEKFFFKNLSILNNYHYRNCSEFKSLADTFFKKKKIHTSDLPFFHIKMFKENVLKSIPNIINTKTYKSSGTSSKLLSKINIDRKTSLLQSKCLTKIIQNIINKKKLKKLYIVDNQKTLIDNQFSARGAAINGFRHLANSYEFLLDENNNIKTRLIKKLKFEKDFMIFGFTSIIWEFFIKKLIKKNLIISKNNGFLFHGGGWKKLENISITRKKYNKYVNKFIGINKIYNYYGMIEQTGSIFIECEKGYFHPSIFSDINIRDKNLNICSLNETGIIQVSSLLPISYPGHNILTEDMGRMINTDGCKCGRQGKFFEIIGRIPKTEIRGCSDVY